ncbi:MAG TPA: hypothetical protein DCY13_22190 [Verrucomicrobiales bacterium]|nr:hypothetical protein [Verrucomicrobiales bacterium]
MKTRDHWGPRSPTSLSPFGTPCLILALLALVVTTAPLEAAARFEGQVVHDATGLPVDNATLELNLEPVDGIPEYTVRSDPFGFFTFPDVDPGNYEFTAGKLGFVNHAEAVTFADGDRKTAVVRLTPADATVTFDIYFQVWCLATHARLEGAVVTTEIWEADGDLSGGPDQVLIRSIDSAGSLVLPSVKEGFYKFSIAKTGWEPIVYTPPPGGGFVTDGDRVRLSTSHYASVFMKPVKTPLSVTVTGYDPVEDAPGELLEGMILNLTGIDATDGSVLLPTRTALTSEIGDFRFGLMPPISYRLVVGRLGYVTKEIEIHPQGDGTFAPVEVDVELEPTKVKAVLSSPYQTANAVNNATIRLQGIRDTNTEGINRELPATTDAGQLTASALFENLLPGRYWMHVAHHATITGFPSSSGNIPGPSAFDVRFFPRELNREAIVGVTEEVPIELEPVPAVIRGRLFATDELANVDDAYFDPEPNRVWRQVAQNGLNFTEHAVVNLLTNPVDQVVIDTDASGAYTAIVYPGVYGVKIPSMTSYTGHNIEFGDLSTGQAPFVRPWPYPDAWPYNNREFGHHGPGLRFDSNHEYQLDLFVHAHYINLCGFVTPSGDPFGQLILRMNLDGTGVVGVDYNHLLDTGAKVTFSGPVSGEVPVTTNNRFLLRNLTPGQYSITMNHPGYAVSPLIVNIGPWQAPGILPIVEPVVTPSYFFPGITHCFSSQGQFELDADWTAQGTIRVKRYNYDAGLADYISVGESNPDYFRMTGLPNRLFSFFGGGGIPNANYTVWEQHGNGWFTDTGSGSMTFDGAFEGGPLDNTQPGLRPTAETTFSLELRAVNQADHSQPIPNVQVQFQSGSPQLAGGVVAHDGSPQPTGATQIGGSGQWQYSFFPPPTVEVLDSATRLMKTTVFMRRQMVVTGQVSAASIPVSGAAVVIRNRQGNPIGRSLTDANGAFSVGFLNPQPVFVDVNKRGFIAQRNKFTPPSVANPDISANFTLQVVPAPTIDAFTLNRFGLFLPGVTYAADAGGLNREAARPKLTVTWKGTARGSSYNVSLEGFVGENDVQKPPEVSQVNDVVEELWLIDRRSFTNAFVNEPDQTNFTQLDPPTPLNYITIRHWLNEITNAEKDGKPHYVVHQLRLRGRNGQTGDNFEGMLYLPELPSGVFNPRLIAITRSGGVAVRDYALPSGKPSLQGMNLPPWAATVLNLIGTGANFGGFDGDRLKGLPGGGFLKVGGVSPTVEARIGLLPADADPADDTSLSYKYVLGIDLPVGEETAATGPMGFGPRFLGLRIQGASTEFEVNGEDKEAALAIVVPVAEPGENEELDENYKPSLTKPKQLVEVLANDFDYSVKVAAALGLDQDPIGNNRIDRFSVILEVQGLYSGGVRFNATPVLRFIPYAGPVLVTADKSGALTIYLRIETALGAKIAGKLETKFAEPLGPTRPGGGDPLPPRPSFMGIESIDPSIEAKLIARLAGGLDASAFGGRIEATGLFQLGAPTGVSDTDGIFFTLNTSTNKTPLITKIEGAFSFVARLKINLWTVRWSKSFQWDFAKWVIDRASEPSFELVPMNIVFTEIKPSAAPGETFVGDASTIVQDFIETGSYALSGGDDPLLVYTGIDSTTGEMTIMASAQTGGQWQTPVEVARAAGVISVATIPLPAGGWLVAWSELSAQDVLNPYPSTTIRFATSNAGGTAWSAPAVVTTANEAMFDLKLAHKNPDLLLTWLGTAEGPLGISQTLQSSAWNGATWSAPEVVVPATSVVDYVLAANEAGAAMVAVSTAAGDLIHSVSSSPWSAPVTLTNTAAGPLSLQFDGPNDAVLAWQNTAGGLELSQYDLAGDTWTHSGTTVPGAFTDELRLLPLEDGGQTLYLLAWVEGGDNGSLHHAFIDPTGAVVMGRREVNLSATGAFNQLELRGLGGHRAAILTHVVDAAGSVLREYPVGLPVPGDCDGDGVSDADEIANGFAADLNNNGVPDECEIAEGRLVDRDHNGVPDALEAAPPGDCNRNGIADLNEIFLGIVSDENANGIPDECELVTRTVPIQPGKPTEFYRALRLIIKVRENNQFEVEYSGPLEKADTLDGPWQEEP